MLILQLLVLLLCTLDPLHERAIGPRLGQRTKQQGQANQARYPDDCLREE